MSAGIAGSAADCAKPRYVTRKLSRVTGGDSLSAVRYMQQLGKDVSIGPIHKREPDGVSGNQELLASF